MIPSGIYVRTELDRLVSNLPSKLEAMAPPGVDVRTDGGGTPPDGGARVSLRKWCSEWCHLEIEGSEKGVTLVLECLLSDEHLHEVLACSYRPGAGEYSYTFFRQGKLLEQFQGRGPAVESVHFISEMRRVPLQDLLQASRFMSESIRELGVTTEPERTPSEPIFLLDLDFPGKPSFWQILLGAAAGR